MNQTRIIFLLGCCLALVPDGASGGELIERGGRFIQLTTDLESPQEADTLVASFDAAVLEWIKFWDGRLRTGDSRKGNGLASWWPQCRTTTS